MSTIDDSIEFLKSFEQQLLTQATAAEKRLAIAKQQTEILTEQHGEMFRTFRKQIGAMRVKAEAKIEEALAAQKRALEELQQLRNSKEHEIEELGSKIAWLETEETTKRALLADLDRNIERLTVEQNNLIEKIKQESNERAEKETQKQNLETEIVNFTTQREQLEHELVSFQNDLTSGRMELESFTVSAKTKKESLNKQLAQISQRLKIARISLEEAENKDKAIRTAWVEQQQQLDKRERAVLAAEARLSDTAKHLQEKDYYMKL